MSKSEALPKMPYFVHFSDGPGWTVATVLADDHVREEKTVVFRLKGEKVASLSPEELALVRSGETVTWDGYDLHFWIESPRTRDHGLPDFEEEIRPLNPPG